MLTGDHCSIDGLSRSRFRDGWTSNSMCVLTLSKVDSCDVQCLMKVSTYCHRRVTMYLTWELLVWNNWCTSVLLAHSMCRRCIHRSIWSSTMYLGALNFRFSPGTNASSFFDIDTLHGLWSAGYCRTIYYASKFLGYCLQANLPLGLYRCTATQCASFTTWHGHRYERCWFVDRHVGSSVRGSVDRWRFHASWIPMLRATPACYSHSAVPTITIKHELHMDYVSQPFSKTWNVFSSCFQNASDYRGPSESNWRGLSSSCTYYSSQWLKRAPMLKVNSEWKAHCESPTIHYIMTLIETVEWIFCSR